MGTNFEDSALSQLMQWVKDDRKIAEKNTNGFRIYIEMDWHMA